MLIWLHFQACQASTTVLADPAEAPNAESFDAGCIDRERLAAQLYYIISRVASKLRCFTYELD